MVELKETERRANLIHFAVDADLGHCFFVSQTEIRQPLDPLQHRRIATDNSSSLDGAEYLGGVKAQYAQIAVAHQAARAIADRESMGSIIDDPQPMACGNGIDRFNVAAVAVTVDWHNRGGSRSDRGLDARRVQGERAG